MFQNNRCQSKPLVFKNSLFFLKKNSINYEINYWTLNKSIRTFLELIIFFSILALKTITNFQKVIYVFSKHE